MAFDVMSMPPRSRRFLGSMNWHRNLHPVCIQSITSIMYKGCAGVETFGMQSCMRGLSRNRLPAAKSAAFPSRLVETKGISWVHDDQTSHDWKYICQPAHEKTSFPHASVTIMHMPNDIDAALQQLLSTCVTIHFGTHIPCKQLMLQCSPAIGTAISVWQSLSCKFHLCCHDTTQKKE